MTVINTLIGGYTVPGKGASFIARTAENRNSGNHQFLHPANWKANYASLEQLRKYVPLERGSYQIFYLGKDQRLSKF